MIETDSNVTLLIDNSDVLGKIAYSMCFKGPDKSNIEFLKICCRLFYHLSRFKFSESQLSRIVLE